MTNSAFRRNSAVALVVLALIPATIALAQVTPGSPYPAPPAQAGQPGGFGRGRMGPGGQPGVPLEWLIRELNLNDAQRGQVNALLEEDHTAVRSHADALRQARQGLDAAITRVPADDALLQAQVQEVSAIETQIALGHARMQSKIFQLLNPEQQARARELLSQRQQQQQQGPRRGRQG